MIKFRCDVCQKETEWKHPTGSREREHEPFPHDWKKAEGSLTAWRNSILHLCSDECFEAQNFVKRERGKYPTFGG